jgi:hypothetical protein
MGRRLALLLTSCLILVASVRPALGDSAPMATIGPHLQPLASTTVRMEQERVEIHLRRDLARPTDFGWSAVAEYRIWFRFVPSADEEMTVGFPLFVIDQESRLDGAPVREMKVEVDGQEVATQRRQAAYGKDTYGSESDWAIFPVTFRRGQPLEMVVTYAMPVSPFGKTWASDFWVAYVLRTGVFWAGSIGRAEVVLTMDKPIREEDIRIGDQRRATTPGWTLADGGLRWIWEDVEPDFDLSLVMANAYWLDTAQDIQALLEKGVSDRDTLLRVLGGTLGLFVGDGRSGMWMKVRGDVSSEKAGEVVLPGVLLLAEAHVAAHPADWEVREQYLWLLRESAVHQSAEAPILLSEDRLARFLREMNRYTADGGPASYLSNSRPWLLPALRAHSWTGDTQAAIAAVLTDEMYYSFSTEAQARDWVAENAGQALLGAHADALLAEALRRVKPPEPPAPAAAAPVTPPAQAEEPAPSEPRSGLPPWSIWSGGLLVLLVAGALAYRKRRRTSI